MSTNKTQNYHLHAWELGDDFLLSEINENFAALDEKAVRVVTGSYTGKMNYDVTTPQRIELGKQIKALFVIKADSVASEYYTYLGLATQGTHMGGSLVVDGTGFEVSNHYVGTKVFLNWKDFCYFYVAWV